MAKDDITLSEEEFNGVTKRESAARHMKVLFEHYWSMVGGDEPQVMLGDLLCDLMHWAADQTDPDVDFGQALVTAEMHFDAESDDPDEELRQL